MENREKLDVMSMELHRAVKGSLRRGDSFSKYSPSQFLILLVGVNQENCDMIFRRIAGVLPTDTDPGTDTWNTMFLPSQRWKTLMQD